MSRRTYLKGLFKKSKPVVNNDHLEVASDEMNISKPTGFVRNIHIQINPETGELEGVPEGWKKYVGSAIRYVFVEILHLLSTGLIQRPL